MAESQKGVGTDAITAIIAAILALAVEPQQVVLG